MAGPDAAGPKRVHLLGRGRQTARDPSTPHHANDRRTSGRQETPLLLVRLYTPHRQGARPLATGGADRWEGAEVVDGRPGPRTRCLRDEANRTRRRMDIRNQPAAGGADLRLLPSCGAAAGGIAPNFGNSGHRLRATMNGRRSLPLVAWFSVARMSKPWASRRRQSSLCRKTLT